MNRHGVNNYIDGKNKYNSAVDAYRAEGLPGILPYMVRIIEWQLPVDGITRLGHRRP